MTQASLLTGIGAPLRIDVRRAHRASDPEELALDHQLTERLFASLAIRDTVVNDPEPHSPDIQCPILAGPRADALVFVQSAAGSTRGAIDAVRAARSLIPVFVIGPAVKADGCTASGLPPGVVEVVRLTNDTDVEALADRIEEVAHAMRDIRRIASLVTDHPVKELETAVAHLPDSLRELLRTCGLDWTGEHQVEEWSLSQLALLSAISGAGLHLPARHEVFGNEGLKPVVAGQPLTDDETAGLDAYIRRASPRTASSLAEHQMWRAAMCQIAAPYLVGLATGRLPHLQHRGFDGEFDPSSAGDLTRWETWAMIADHGHHPLDDLA